MDDLLVHCPTCGQPNPRGHRFCGGCGVSLPVSCPACGAPPAAGQKFCGECGSSLAGSPAPVEPPPPPASPELPPEDRRVVTSLFCDLVGFTPLSERLDPEEVREIQAEYFSRVDAEIERYGGTVQKYAGDAVLAVFGAPVAHEGDAERAVLCGLGIQEAFQQVAADVRAKFGVETALRVGINTGEVISGGWSASSRQDMAVTGDAVNTAARLQTAAEPGGVLVGAETRRLTRRRIEYGEPQEFDLKGKSSPVPGYPVLGVRAQPAERWEVTGQRVAFLGRDAELQQLLTAWREASLGAGQLVSVVGEAGTGKSRLVAEAIESIQFGGTCRLLRGRCYSYGATTSLWLVADVVRSLCDIPERQDPELSRARLRQTVVRLLTDAGEEEWDTAYDVLGDALGLGGADSPVTGTGPQVRRRALVRTLARLLAVLADQSPVLLLLEDLHWVDAASAEVLAELLADVSEQRLLAISTSRTEGQAAWMDAARSTRLELEPLDGDSTASLAASLLGGRQLGGDLVARLGERSGGNPFFLEELIRSLQESGGLVETEDGIELASGVAETLPWELTDVLLARLDRLDPEARGVAQTGSVLGRAFAAKLLAMTLGLSAPPGRALDVLLQTYILYLRGEEDLEYVFKHATLSEAAYSTLLLRRRRAIHALAARAIIALYGEEERVEIIAYHFAHTEEHAEAALWLERAGDRAASMYANEEARRRYIEARERLEQAGGSATDLARLDEKRGGVLKTMGQFEAALETLEAAVSGYQVGGDREGELRTVAQIGRVHRLAATQGEGIARIKGLLETAQHEEASAGLAALYVALARLLGGSDQHDEQLEAARRGSDLAHLVGETSLRAEAEFAYGTALFKAGRDAEGFAILENAIPLAEASADLDVLSSILNNVALLHINTGQLERCREIRLRSVQLSERIGDPSKLAVALAGLGQTLFYLGDWVGVREALDQAVALARRTGRGWYVVYPLVFLAHLFMAVGEWSRADDMLSEAEEIGERSRDASVLRFSARLRAEGRLMRGQEALDCFAGVFAGSPLDAVDVSYVLPTLAWAQLNAGNTRSAEETIEEAIKRCRAEPDLVDLLDALRIAGLVATSQGHLSDAYAYFDEAIDRSVAMSCPYPEARARLQYGIALQNAGDEARATEELTAALTLFAQLNAIPSVELAGQALRRPLTSQPATEGPAYEWRGEGEL